MIPRPWPSLPAPLPSQHSPKKRCFEEYKKGKTQSFLYIPTQQTETNSRPTIQDESINREIKCLQAKKVGNSIEFFIKKLNPWKQLKVQASNKNDNNKFLQSNHGLFFLVIIFLKNRTESREALTVTYSSDLLSSSFDSGLLILLLSFPFLPFPECFSLQHRGKVLQSAQIWEHFQFFLSRSLPLQTHLRFLDLGTIPLSTARGDHRFSRILHDFLFRWVKGENVESRRFLQGEMP